MKKILIIVVLLMILLFIKILIDTIIIKKRYYQIKNHVLTIKKDKCFNGIKIIYFSDLHLGKCLKKKSFFKLMDKLKKMDGDIYIFGGDLFGINTMKYFHLKEIQEGFNRLKDKCVLAVYGNHEYYHSSKLPLNLRQQIYQNLPFKILKNEMFIFSKNKQSISIYGVDSATQVNKNTSSIKADLIISHEGDVIDYYNRQIMLSGHTHGGQIRIPFLPLLYKPKDGKKYRHGLYNIKDNQLLVSNGIGFSRIKLRFFAKREIIIIDYK